MELTMSEKRGLSGECGLIRDRCQDQGGETCALHHLAMAALMFSDYQRMQEVIALWDAKPEQSKKALEAHRAWRVRRERERWELRGRPHRSEYAKPDMTPDNEFRWGLLRFQSLRVALYTGAPVGHPLWPLAILAEERYDEALRNTALWAWDHCGMDTQEAIIDKAKSSIMVLSDQEATELLWWIPVLRGERPTFVRSETAKTARLTRSEQVRLRALKERLQGGHEAAAS